MQLEIIDHENVLGIDFGKWLIKKIQDKFIASINEDKLIKWDAFFEESNEYKSIYKKKISTKEILIVGIRNLVCNDIPQKLIITINKNQFVPGLDRVKIDVICRLINFGNTSIKGYPIFTEVLTEVSENIGEYIDMYIEGI